MTSATAGPARCTVWWAHVGWRRSAHEVLLDAHQVRRLHRLARAEDQDRLVVGAALSRAVVGGELSREPSSVRFDRTCRVCGRPHGKPVIIGGGGLEMSVSHSGEWVVVAVGRRPVGVDVEQHGREADVAALAEHTLAEEERSALQALPAAARWDGFLRYWTRKEAVLKATGDGLGVPMDELVVSGPDEPAALRSWRGRLDMPQRITVVDLHSRPGHTAALAILDCPSAEVEEHDAWPLLVPDMPPRGSASAARRDPAVAPDRAGP